VMGRGVGGGKLVPVSTLWGVGLRGLGREASESPMYQIGLFLRGSSEMFGKESDFSFGSEN